VSEGESHGAGLIRDDGTGMRGLLAVRTKDVQRTSKLLPHVFQELFLNRGTLTMKQIDEKTCHSSGLKGTSLWHAERVTIGMPTKDDEFILDTDASATVISSYQDMRGFENTQRGETLSCDRIEKKYL
jgi:hypothetical protein